LRKPDAKVASIKGLKFTNFALIDDGKQRWKVGK